jgi:iron complex transport system permease protein
MSSGPRFGPGIARAALTPQRRRAALAVLGALVVISILIGVSIGPDGLGWAPALLPLRAGRVLLAAVVGAGLAATGAALQALLKNPLADPYVLGVSGGAALGGALAITVGAAGALGAGLGLHAAAAAGAAAASALLAWFLARDRGGRSETALLVGVTLNAFSWALVAVVRAALPADRTQILSVWLVGSVGYPEWRDLGIAALVTLFGIGVLVRISGDLALLRAGEGEAARLGVDLGRARLLAYGAASLLVGVAVSTSGVIGFVGLIAPHAVRLAVGKDERVVLPASALAGALALVVFDTAARASFSLFESEVPTGALTAVVGAPLFALALWRRVAAGGARGERA